MDTIKANIDSEDKIELFLKLEFNDRYGERFIHPNPIVLAAQRKMIDDINKISEEIYKKSKEKKDYYMIVSSQTSEYFDQIMRNLNH